MLQGINNKPSIKKVLILRLTAMGDVAMTIPAIYSLARSYPTTQLTVLTNQRFIPIFINCPPNISFIPFDSTKDKSIIGMTRLLYRLSKQSFDAVADLHDVLRSWLIDLLFWMKGAMVCRLQKNRSERKQILAPHHFKQAIPYIQRYFDVFTRLGFQVQPLFGTLFQVQPRIPISMVKNVGTRWIGIAPFASVANKIYPLNQMEEVIATLSETPDMELFLFGGGNDEVTIMHEWTNRYPHVHSLAGKLTLPQELKLMSHLDVMVSMDSSNMHLASLVGIRVISIWGGTTPYCGYHAWKQHEEDELCSYIPCQPCCIIGSKKCSKGDFRCLKSVSSQQIIDKILGL